MVLSLLKMSLSATVLILAVVAIRALAIHRLLKNTFLFLWGVALCRLLIPFSIPLPLNIYTNVGQPDGTLLKTTTIPYQAMSLNANPEQLFYEAKLLQFDYDTTVANSNNPNSTANARRLGDKGTGNIERIAHLIRSQKTDDLIPCRTIDISFFIDRDNGQATFDSINFDAI